MGSYEDQRLPLPDAELRVRLYRPASAAQAGALVFFHGGGLVVGGLAAHDKLCAALSQAACCLVVSVDYAWDATRGMLGAVDDAYAAVCAVHEHADTLGFDHRKLAIGGESVGATLATVVARLAKDRRNPPLCLQLLLCPVLSLEATWGAGIDRDLARGTQLTAAKLEAFADSVLRSALEKEDPRISPLYAKNLIGMCKSFVLTAEHDPTRVDTEVYVGSLQDAHVDTVQLCCASVTHAFLSLASEPERHPGLVASAQVLAQAFAG